MALSEKALATRNRILYAANELFYLHGFNATGLDKVIKAASVTKGNFYYHFKSKEELAIASLDWHFAALIKELETSVFSQKSAPLVTLYAVLEYLADRQKMQRAEGYVCGCYFGNFSLELSTTSKAMRDKLSAVFEQIQQMFADLLQQAIAAGEISHAIDTVSTSSMILSQIEGAMLLDKASQDTKAVDNSIAFIKRFLSS